ncbi:phage tail assembly protein [Bartonella sp. CL266QHHD]|uniref:phage tail assembly protein n=1 Tax=Bartonella sp. CL266QHHD TaxID=3243519 RepID=UPI0035D10CB2
MNITERATYQLLGPIKVEGKTYTEITLRRPKFKDLKAIQSKEGDEQSIEKSHVFQGGPIMPSVNLVFVIF